jgi:hypothetical protein
MSIEVERKNRVLLLEDIAGRILKCFDLKAARVQLSLFADESLTSDVHP